MNKTIIAIYGRADEGKSETIKNVCRLILDLFPNATPSHSPIDYSGDILVTIKVGAVKIGIESQGDPKSRMLHEETIKKLANTNDKEGIGGCDIIVCATRTRGDTVKEVDKIANMYDFNTLWLSSYWSSSLNYHVLNRMEAENIINIIKSIIVEQI